MKNNLLILGAALIALSSCSVNKPKTTNEDSAAAAPLFARMSMKDTIKAGDSVLMKFTVYNNADSAQQFCKWHTPFEPLMSKYLEVKDQTGQEMQYQGAMAKRMMPPPASSYIKVNAKDSLSASVDLVKGYALKQPSKYTIIYVGENMSGLVVKDSISFIFSK
ncbi:MAG: protease [Mucilaginibacter sp.]|uniref:protease n=1 Tax=Mucilaginibacter sp. TaxID=1882438 RepID=UPI0031A209A1